MRALALILSVGCAIDAPALSPQHPANPAAPTGRLAGAPASLRPGVASYPDVPVSPPEPPAHHHH